MTMHGIHHLKCKKDCSTIVVAYLTIRMRKKNLLESVLRYSANLLYVFIILGDYAVRIIEFTETEILMMKDKYSTKIKLTDNFLSKEVTDSSLKITDAPFSDVEILPESYITAEEFEAVWYSPKSEQKKLFGKNVSETV